MKDTTIAIPQKLKEKLNEFGRKGETYSEIIGRLVKSAENRQIEELLMDTSDSISVKDALERAKKKWRK